jgi:DNA primase
MSRRIPQSFIHELVARADIVDVVGRRVQLKQAGKDHKGLCPFHDEKTPSFTVSPSKGFFKCFGCGAYGNAIDFIMRYENRAFPEAVEILAESMHIEVPVELSDDEDGLHARLYRHLTDADRLFRDALKHDKAAIDYLKRRGIDGETAARFGLGYAPDAWDTVVKALGRNDEICNDLITAGLAVRSEKGRVYDRFRNRITFPIRDSRGRTIGFGGRVLGDDEPKYLNSPDTPLFDKSRTLYGLFESRQQPGRPSRIVVVEGYADVIALAQFGVGPAIATMGTATTADNVRNLTRLSDRIVFCFDGDRAGRAAAWRALESVLPYAGGSVEIAFLLLPDGEDPDSFVRARGAEAFTEALDSAQSLSSFLVAQAAADVRLDDADGRARFVARVRPLLEKLPQGVYRELVLAQTAEAIGMTPESLETALSKPATTGSAQRDRARSQKANKLMRDAIALIAHYPRSASAVAVAGVEALEGPGSQLLKTLLEIVRSEPQITTAELVERLREDPEGRHLGQLVAEEPRDGEDMAATVLADCLAKMVEKVHRSRRGDPLRQWRPRPAPD